jgi:putative membrane-bound dehydrogenase-like protein
MPRRPPPWLILGFASAALSGAEFPAPFDTEKLQEGFTRPEVAVAGFVMPPGFRAQIFAAEPEVRQPIALTTDARGRVWVAENYTYAERPRRWEPALRDRIVVFEDRDGDGRADGRKVFWDEGRQLTSVETGFGGVWALCPPQLLFIPDRNGDDVPDGPPEVLLDGFSSGAAIGHNIANGLKWGPDGWLYGRHGILDTSAVGRPGAAGSQRVRFNCAIWRYHPTRKIIEVVSHGGTNAWGLDFDRHGQMFYTNTVIGHLWHVIPGAYYRRMFGAHLNPHAYEIIEQTADHFHWNAGAEKWNDIKAGPLTSATDRFGGGHVHIGCMIYQGGAWPEAYRDALFTCNLQGNRVNVDTLHRDGGGYTARHAPDFLRAADQWFRGLELLTLPDGNVLIADWNDTGECHDNDGVHRSSGRLYKISHGREPMPPTTVDIAQSNDAELVGLQSHRNAWFARTARRILQERAIEQRDLSAARSELQRILKSKSDEVIRLRALWCLHSIGAMTEASLRALLDDGSEHVRTWAIRLLRESAVEPEPATLRRLEALARSDASGLVRVFLASFLQRIAPAQRWPLAAALAARAGDRTDRQQPLMVWYGVESAVPAHAARAAELAETAAFPLVRRLITRRLAEEIERQPQGIERLVAFAAKPGTPDEARTDVLRGMAEGLRGWSHAEQPGSWEKLVTALERENGSADARRLQRELSLLFGSGRAEAELIAIVRNSSESANARRGALLSLARNPKPEYLPLFTEWTKERTLAPAAARALGHLDDSGIPKLLLDLHGRLGLAVRTEVVEALVSRPAYALALLRNIEDGRMPRDALSAFQARQIRSLGDPALNAKLATVWGEVRDTPEAKRAAMKRWAAELGAGAIAAASPAAGREIFVQRCASCHQLNGEGGQIGPDLTGADRRNIAYLLENILDPGAVVPRESQMTILKLRDGRVLSGVIAEENERAYSLQTPAGRVPIARGDVAELQRVPGSLMPEGLLEGLPARQVRELFAFLMSDEPAGSSK